MRVKICGIKNVEDALKSVEYGADAIGVLVGQEHNSKDFISIKTAKKIIESLPPLVSSVLVTHINNSEEISHMIKTIGVTTVQLHSDIDIQGIEKIKFNCPNVKIIKLVHVIDEKSMQQVDFFANSSDAILLDTINNVTDQVGGTGKTHNWEIDRKIVEHTNAKIIIAGGLNPNNIKEAIHKIKPYGVDVNTGVQNKNGLKDYEKLKEFIRNAKEC